MSEDFAYTICLVMDAIVFTSVRLHWQTCCVNLRTASGF